MNQWRYRPPRRPAQGLRTTFGRRSGVAFAVALLLAFGLGPAQAARPHSNTAVAHTPQTASASGPPPVRLFTSFVVLALHPYTSCWTSGNSGVCYDGFPPRPLPSLGGTEGGIRLAFAREHWRLEVRVADKRGRHFRLHMVRTSPRSWRLAVGSLRNGRYTADVFGTGPQGDVAAAFAFTLT
jgi:hypothetical protein